jgi:hypothetical protein
MTNVIICAVLIYALTCALYSVTHTPPDYPYDD